MKPDARTAREHDETIREALRKGAQAQTGSPQSQGSARAIAALDALLAQVERLDAAIRHVSEIQDSEIRRKVEAYDAARAEVKREGFSRAEYVLRAEAAEDRAVQAERERNEAQQEVKRLKAEKEWWEKDANTILDTAKARAEVAERALAEALCTPPEDWEPAKAEWHQFHLDREIAQRTRAEAAEACAQRYREALTYYGNPTPKHKSPAVARHTLSADPLVCRDPNLCWGTGTCPRDPACDE